MTSRSIYVWKFEKDGRELSVKVGGQLVLNNADFIVNTAVAGHGLAHLIEDRVAPLLAEGALDRVFEDWCEPIDG